MLDSKSNIPLWILRSIMSRFANAEVNAQSSAICSNLQLVFSDMTRELSRFKFDVQLYATSICFELDVHSQVKSSTCVC